MPGLAFQMAQVNGQPGAVIRDGESKVISVMALDIAEGRVQGIRSVVNPDKLRHLGPVADTYELLRRRDG
jgi:RNA polymerase sigma-70 factor (ECF subfamily)